MHQAVVTPPAHAPPVGEPHAPDSLSPGSRQAAPQRRRPNPDVDGDGGVAAEARDADGAEGDGDERSSSLRQLRIEKWRDLTLKRSLAGHLRNERYLPTILRLVAYFSRIINLGHLLMSATIVKNLNDNEGNLTFIRSLQKSGRGSGDLYSAIRAAMILFTRRGDGHRKNVHERYRPIEDMYDASFEAQFETLPWEELTSSALTIHAQKIATNFRNTFLEIPFRARIKAGVTYELSRNGLLDKRNKKIALKAILENNDTEELPPEMADFVNKIRKLLHTGDPDGELPAEPQPVNKFFLENDANHERVLKVYHFILTKMDAGGPDHPGKRFSIFPTSGFFSHHVAFNKEMLKKLLVEARVIPRRTPKAAFEAQIENHFNRVINMDRLRKSGQIKNEYTNTYIFETDGVAVSFGFLRPPGDEDPQRRRPEFADADVDEVTWGIDPGVINIVHAVRQTPDHGFESRILTRKRYYRDAGMDRARRINTGRNFVLRECHQDTQECSLKTANHDRIIEYATAHAPHVLTIWTEVLKRKYAQCRFGVYLGKRRVLDAFFRSLRIAARTNIAFGAARFPSSKKGWGRSVPTVSVRRACTRIFPQTVEVEEYRTSKVCPTCLSQLQQVFRPQVAGDARQQRGILRCKSRMCASTTFKNRDEVGARNILTCHLAERRGEPRPGFLRRGMDEGWESNPTPRHYLRPPR